MSGDSFSIVQIANLNDSRSLLYRTKWTSEAIAKRHPEWTIVCLDALDPVRFEWAEKADLLVLVQSCDLDLLPLIHQRKKEGRKTLFEFFENIYEPMKTHPDYDFLVSPPAIQAVEMLVETSDAVLVNSASLEKKVNVRFSLPTYIVRDHLIKFPLKESSQLITENKDRLLFGWAGSMEDLPNLLSVLPAIREALIDSLDIKFSVICPESALAFLDLPPQRMEYTPWESDYESHPTIDKWRVGILPLLKTEYNECIGEIKFSEMISQGVLPVVAKDGPFRELVERLSWPSYRDSFEMKNLIMRFINDSAFREHWFRIAFHELFKNTVSDQCEERATLYQKYFPASSQGKKILGPGFHWIRGRGDYSPSRDVIANVDQLLKSKQKVQAEGLLQSFIRQNEYHPEVWLKRLAVLKSLNQERFQKVLTECLEKFPKDLRFKILRVEQLGLNSQEADQLIENLKDISDIQRKSYHGILSGMLSRVLKQDPEFVSSGQKILDLFPQSLRMHIELAKLYEWRGASEKAKEHWAFVSNYVNSYDLNHEAANRLTKTQLRTIFESMEISE